MTLKWNLRQLGVFIGNKTLNSLNCLETIRYLNTNTYTIMKVLQTHSIQWCLVTFFITFVNFRIPAVSFVVSAGASAHLSTCMERIGGLTFV
jgi:hypothetical protein